MATPAEIADSLTMDEIPIKLRCATCNKLANNAFRMPCCDQSICEDCQSSLAQACPICFHEPVNRVDCRQNKALRTTIKVFLKKKGMERDAAKKKEMLEKAAAAPPTPPTPLPSEASMRKQSETPAVPATDAQLDSAEKRDEVQRVSQPPEATEAADQKNPETGIPTNVHQDAPQKSIESPGPQGTPRRASTQTVEDGTAQDKSIQRDQQSEQQGNMMGQSGPGQGMNAGFGFDGSIGGFPNMGMNGMGDFSQMMQFMPNGMQNNMMGSFPNMMGMPGMGMDPMAMSQGMYGGFGGPGMGMNGMNGMNMGMGFDAGQGAFGAFNGQPAAWNAGQDKFNQNGYGGHANGMGGNFGTNAGYGGYNMPSHQGSFNQMNHHQYPNNDFQRGYQNQGFQNRGRGRGRGGFPFAGRGRGNAQVMQGNANHQPYQQQVPKGPVRRGSPQYTPIQGPHQQNQADDNIQDANPEDPIAKQAVEDQINKELDPGDAEDHIEENMPSLPDMGKAEEPAEIEPEEVKPAEAPESVGDERPPEQTQNPEDLNDSPRSAEEDTKPSPIQTFISTETTEPEVHPIPSVAADSSAMLPPPSPAIPTGPARLTSHEPQTDTSPRGHRVGRGFHRNHFDRRSASIGRGQAPLPTNGNATHSPSLPVVEKSLPRAPVVEPKGLGVEGAPKGPKALRQGPPNTGVRDNTGFSIIGRASAAARTRPAGEKRNSPASTPTRSRTRSRSPPRQESSHNRHHRQRSASPSKHDEQERRRERHRHHARKYEDEREENYDSKTSRTRDTSVDTAARRSSRRNHRDYDKEEGSTRSSHRSHRSHRERSTEPSLDHRISKKRSRSPEHRINGASRMHRPPESRYREKEDEQIASSRKRRDRNEEGRHRERKRSKRDHEYSDETDSGSRSKHKKRDERDLRPKYDRPRESVENPSTKTAESVKSPPTGPKAAKVDQHALEREARDRERQMKEIQRRAIMGGTKDAGGKGRERGAGRSGAGGRKLSYKHEDEESNEARASRVESEREASRWS